MTDIVDRLNDSLSAGYSELRREAAAEITRLRARIEAMERQEPVAWMLNCQTLGGDTGWMLSWTQSGAGMCNRLSGEENERKLYTLPGAQPAPSALAEAIIADMQAQHDSELITENDSGEALIRLDGAIAAVEDNFALAQPAPSVPEGVKKVTRGFHWNGAAQHHTPTIEVEFEPVPAGSPNNAKGWQDRDRLAAMLAAAPEAKP